MLDVNFELRSSGLRGGRIVVQDPYTDWEMATSDFDSHAFHREDNGTFYALFDTAPDETERRRWRELFNSIGVDTNVCAKFEKFWDTIPEVSSSINKVTASRNTDTPQVSYGDKSRSEPALKVKAAQRHAVINGLMKAVGASWFSREHQWRVPRLLRDKVQLVLSAFGSRLSDPWKLPVFNDSSLLEKFPFVRRHQLDCAHIVWDSFRSGRHGLLVTDEMGTGKTISSLLAALQFCKAGYADRVVCVVPSSLIEKEENWCGDLERLFGISPKRPGLPASKRRKKDPDPEESLVSIYSYPSLRNPDILSAAIADARDAIVIFDELHTCVNDEKQLYRNAFMVSQAGRYSIGLSGTPVKNDMQELWPLVHILDPEVLPYKEFMDNYADFEEKDIYVSHRNSYDRMGEPGLMTVRRRIVPEPEKLLERLSPILLRRDREEVLSSDGRLTFSKSILKISMEGSPELAVTNAIGTMYKQWLGRYMPEPGQEKNLFDWTQLDKIPLYIEGEDEGRLDTPEDKKGEKKSNKKMDRENLPLDKQMGEMGARLVLANDDPGKLLFAPPDSPRGDVLTEKLNEQNLVTRYYVPRKARVLQKFLEEPQRKDKKYVVFCAHVATAESLTRYFTRVGIESVCISGQVTGKKRTDSRNAFKDDPKVRLLICTDVLGNGVNLGFADGVVHYSLPWTSAAKDQRDSRVLRLDSEGHKEIVTLLSDLYIDRRKAMIQKTKNNLLESVIQKARENTKVLMDQEFKISTEVDEWLQEGNERSEADREEEAVQADLSTSGFEMKI